ncbi:MAG: cysteine peptidase family C39 domain-containing protein [Gammaproteobacteria bacterium]
MWFDRIPEDDGRRWLAPEVVQTSAMDCGPAALKCLLEGFHIPVSYGRLREACQTDIDGTSIDMLEQVAVQLGLDAAQVMVPADHLLIADNLPALVVVQLADGLTYFVVAWRLHGAWLRDGSGERRRWVPKQRFLGDLYIHRQPVAASVWREWAGSAGLTLLGNAQGH